MGFSFSISDISKYSFLLVIDSYGYSFGNLESKLEAPSSSQFFIHNFMKIMNLCSCIPTYLYDYSMSMHEHIFIQPWQDVV